MNLSFNGFNENVITFEAEPALTKAGVAVKITADGKAAPAVEGDSVYAVAVNVRDGYAAVQVGGFVNVPAAEKIPCGMQKISVNAEGCAVCDESGAQVLVVVSDEQSAGIIL